VSIEIITKPRVFRRFLVYDLEWIPGSLDVRMVGVYSEEGGKPHYRHYKTVAKFLRNELTKENRGKWFFAHAGGLADIQFVLDVLVNDPTYQCHRVKASFSGSSAIIVKVSKNGHTWTFIDSYWLLRDKLANIATWIGMKKTGPADEDNEEKVKEWYANQPMETLVEYNENDCRVLYRAIDEFETTLLSFGGQLQTTIASSAMYLFRRKYLTQAIPTHESVNEKARKAYFASRVEVFKHEAHDAFYYDINSSFPYAMTFPCPGELIGNGRTMPLGSGYPFLADVEVEIPDCYLTPTPIRHGGRIFFPIGKWRSWLSSVDIELLIKEGGRILALHECLTFEPFHDLSAYSRDIYERRRASTDPMERTVLKFLLNSLYGKFAESSEKQAVHIHPSEATLKRLTLDNMLFPGVWEETTTVPVPHMWVPIAVHITAVARRTLYDFLGMTRHFQYCDTDGFSTNDRFATSDQLGQLKLEREVKYGRFVQPKLYRLDERVRAKGFSLGYDEAKKAKRESALRKFETLVNGGEIEVTRMARIRENLRHGTTKPKEGQIIKRLSDNQIPKRCFSRSGVSRPWTIEEIRRKVKG